MSAMSSHHLPTQHEEPEEEDVSTTLTESHNICGDDDYGSESWTMDESLSFRTFDSLQQNATSMNRNQGNEPSRRRCRGSLLDPARRAVQR